MATCRFCDTPLSFALVDLGEVPLANSYLSTDQLEAEEPRFSLKPPTLQVWGRAGLWGMGSPRSATRPYILSAE